MQTINMTGGTPATNKQVIQPVLEYIGIYSAGRQYYKNADAAYLASPENAYRCWYDGSIQQPLTERILNVIGQEWTIEPTDKKNRRQLARANQFKGYVNRIPEFTKYLYALQTACWFGKSGVQNVFDWFTDHDGNRYLGVKSWSAVHGDSIYFRWDEGFEDRIGVLVQGSSGQPGVQQLNREQVIPTDIGLSYLLNDKEREQFVIHTHLHLGNDYYHFLKAGSQKGVGLRDVCYWVWYCKQEFQGILVEFAERVGTGITLWKYDASNPDNLAAVQSIAQNLAANGQIFYPVMGGTEYLGAAVERIEPNAAGIDNLRQIIQYYDNQLKLMIIGQTLSSGTAATGMGSQVAETHENTAWKITRFDSANLEETITRDLIRILHKYSYPEDDFDLHFKFAPQLPNPKQLLDGIKLFYDMGGSIVESEVASLLGLTVPGESDVVLSKAKNEPVVKNSNDLDRYDNGETNAEPESTS